MQNIKILEYFDYRQLFKDLYFERTSKSHKFSLSDFSMELGIGASHLSQILNHQKGLSLSLASKVADRLSLNPEEKNHFFDLVSLHSSSMLKREQARMRIFDRQKSQGKTENPEHFSLLEKWYYIAILQTCFCFKIPVYGDQKKLAYFLGIPEKIAREALERLYHVQVIQDQGGFYAPSKNYFEIGAPQKGSPLVQDYHLRILDLAKDSLRDQSLQEREFNSMMMPISKKDIKKAKKAIDQFHDDLLKTLNTGEKAKDAVYCLSSQFFKISKT